jgi:acyl-CoA hydrolase
MTSAQHTFGFNLLSKFGSDSIRQLALLIAIVVLTVSCSKVTEEAIPPGSVVLALGDSLTEGLGVNPQEAWPNLLATKTGWVVINGGVSGDTSSDALQRLPALLDQHKPSLVLVTLGGNDMLRHIPQEETVANLEKIVSLIKAHGAKPLLLATPKPSIAGAVFRNLTPAEFYGKVAQTQKIPLIKNAIADVLSDPLLKGDPLHPNAAGHVLLSEKIYEELKLIGYVR